jgi:hypothetical protein
VEIDWRLVLAALGLTVLTILLTGPGLWSESWGWWWMRDRRGADEKPRR